MNEPGVGLFLMSSRGLAVLEALLADPGPGRIAYVVTATDPGAKDDSAARLQALAREAGLPVFSRAEPAASHPPAALRFAAAWRWLLPLDPASPLVIFHDSLLPRYRGFAPVVSALVNGDPELGVTALLAAAAYDTGPILAQEPLAIRHPLQIAAAFAALGPCYGRLARQVLADFHPGRWQPRPQDETQATYSLWRDEEDYAIDWSLDAARIQRHIDATGAPYAGASTLAGTRRLRVLAGTARPDCRIENRTPGKILFLDQGRPVVVCGSGLLRLDELRDDATGASALPWLPLRTRFGSA